MTNLSYRPFADVNTSDPFFDSLKKDYSEFPQWFEKKAQAGEKAYLFRSKGIQGFLYIKLEIGSVDDIDPPLPDGKHIKIGTMKINPHGTKLGQRFVKKTLDHAMASDADDIYVTVFPQHTVLIRILETYGFHDYGRKHGPNGEEFVYRKDLRSVVGDVLLDYPRVSIENAAIYLLAIYPEYHTKFLPDSKLHNESFDIVEDISHANSIHKIYISGVPSTSSLKRGDLLLLYRTTDIPGKAYFRSVATSVGVVEEIRKIGSFPTENAFMRYVRPYSVFPALALEDFYANKKRRVIIKFTYNVALKKRVIRKLMLEEAGLPGGGRRWDFLKLTNAQLNGILHLGNVNESYFVN